LRRLLEPAQCPAAGVPEGDDRAEAAFAEVYQAGGVQDRLLVDQGEVIAGPADYVDAPIVFRQ
jgi:hypothetical protein